MEGKFYKSQVLKKVGECLYRNGNGTYFAILKINGKQVKKTLDTNDAAIAKRRLGDLRGKLGRVYGNDNRNMRFDELTENWLETIKPRLKVKSYKRRAVAINGLLPFFKDKLVRSIGYHDIEQWERKRGAAISPRSHNIELETLKILLRYAEQRGIIIDNLAEKFNRRKQPSAIVDIPTKPEFSTLVHALRSSKQSVATGSADMVEFLAYSGMRVGEACYVRVEDINFENATVRITGGENGTKNHKERVIPLFPNLREVAEQIINKKNNKNRSNVRLFDIDSPRGAIKLAVQRTGMRHFTVHSLRHFFASNAIEQGINFKVIANWLGHSDGGMLVAKTYGHLRSEFSAEMALKMAFSVDLS